MNTWTSLTNLGVEFAVSPSQRRSIFLSNVISLVLFFIGLILFVIYYFWYGWSVITAFIPVIALISLIPLLLNYWKLSGFGRLWICLFVPTTVMALSIYSKTIYYNTQEELDYFTFRIIMLSSCVFPPISFRCGKELL